MNRVFIPKKKKELNLTSLFHLFLLWAFCLPLHLVAQIQFHTPSEILTLLQTSKVGYEVGPLIIPIKSTDGPVLGNGYYVEKKDNLQFIKSYAENETEEIKKLRLKANDMLNRENADYKAIQKLLEKVLKLNPQHGEVMTQLGLTYFEMGEEDIARQWYEKAIHINPQDYYAHWQLAEALLYSGNVEEAKREIAIAHILNRNLPRLFLKMKDVFFISKTPYADWQFLPQYQISEPDNTRVAIDASGIWLTYALYKAVWKYEPNYAASMVNGAGQDLSQLEEMESLLGLYLTYATYTPQEGEVYPELDALGKAIENEMLEEYIMYEIILPRQPIYANYLDEAFMDRILKYLYTVRVDV